MQVTIFFCVFNMANKIANKVKLATNFFVFCFSAANKVVNKSKARQKQSKEIEKWRLPLQRVLISPATAPEKAA